jgi:hypothetical protein
MSYMFCWNIKITSAGDCYVYILPSDSTKLKQKVDKCRHQANWVFKLISKLLSCGIIYIIHALNALNWKMRLRCLQIQATFSNYCPDPGHHSSITEINDTKLWAAPTTQGACQQKFYIGLTNFHEQAHCETCIRKILPVPFSANFVSFSRQLHSLQSAICNNKVLRGYLWKLSRFWGPNVV